MAQGPGDDGKKPKKKVAKTLLFEQVDALEAIKQKAESAAQQQAAAGIIDEKTAKAAKEAALKDQHEKNALRAQELHTLEDVDPVPGDAEKPQRRVAKTLIFDPSSAVAAAEAIEAKAAQTKAEQAIEPKALKVEVEEPENGTELPKRKVAKTLMFDPAVLEEEEEAEAAATAVNDKDTRANIAAHNNTSAPSNDDAPALNIDAPPVKLFFEEGAEEQKPKRRVPKTILFTSGSIETKTETEAKAETDAARTATTNGATKSQTGSGVDAPRRLSTKSIAKSFVPQGFLTEALHEDQADVPHESTAGAEAPAKPLRKMRGEQYVAKTMLDHSMLFEQVARNQHKLEEKAIETAREKAREPVVPFVPITAKKKALACDWTWDETYSNERYRYCGVCQRPVYNFAGIEMPEAEAIILKAENLTKFTLYQRADGKFMTGNCSRALKKRNDMILMSVGGVLLVAFLLLYMAMLPHPKPQPQTVAAPPTVPSATTAGPGKVPPGSSHLLPNGTKLQPGASHYDPVSGKMIVDVPVAPPPPPPVANTAGPDEVEQDWEFHTPQK